MNTETTLRKALHTRGISMREAAESGIPYATIVAHCLGLRGLSLKSALRYEAKLNIPLRELADGGCALPAPAAPPSGQGSGKDAA